MPQSNILDNKDFIKSLIKLGSLSIRAKYVVEGFITGTHSSPYHGSSLDFAQHREYSPGDELRHLDWKIYARTDKFFIKQYLEETNLRSYILLDISRSMTYKLDENETDKLTYGIHLAAILSYMLLRQEDSVGLALFDNKIREFIPSRANLSHFSNITGALEKIQPGDDTNISSISSDFSSLLKKRGLIIVISDLFDDPESVIRTFKQFRFKHHDIVIFQVITNSEKEFPFKGDILFQSVEDQALKIKCNPVNLRREYRRLFNDFILQYKVGFRRSGIDYCLLTTDTPFETGLGNFLAVRNKK